MKASACAAAPISARGWRMTPFRAKAHCPVNPSGGALIANPIFCAGMVSIAEVVNQLRGRAGRHQVAQPRIGLAHAASGFAMQYHTVIVFERGDAA